MVRARCFAIAAVCRIGSDGRGVMVRARCFAIAAACRIGSEGRVVIVTARCFAIAAACRVYLLMMKYFFMIIGYKKCYCIYK